MTSEYKDKIILATIRSMKVGLKIKYLGAVGRDKRFDESYDLARGKTYTIGQFKFNNEAKRNCSVYLKETHSWYNIGVGTVYVFTALDTNFISHAPKNKPRKCV